MDTDTVFSNFPVNGILPKKETGALSFLQKYPNYDGRNTLIAIFDTGVDPGAPGLQTTTDSKPKIVDLIDATGSGDVDISTIRTQGSNGELTGLTGRKLTIPSSWRNPSGKWHLGVKDLFELCSSTLRDRLKKERKEKLWQPSNDEAVFRAQSKLNELNNNSSSGSPKNSKPAEPDSTTSGGSQDVASSSSEANNAKDLNELSTSLNKEDLQAQLDLIKDLESKIKDVGPVYDCIVWNDGEKWRACVDTSEKGELENCKVLTNFRDEHEYGTFSYQDMLNYTVRIMPDENVLQIVTDSTSHGTHVASIAAGFFPDKPELNGIAPGAQIISVKIGDNRINGMETGFAIVNACRYAAEYKCDLVNFSFGEPVHYSNMGPALTAIQELVTQYGVVYCASAGNNGPGIETVGAPGGSIPEIVSVAAYVTADMIKCEHSLLGNPAAGMLFTWSSRGPQLDGQWGVSVCAPGGAFAAVPNWTQRGTQLMSGTSMASPNCTGCIALVLSGLKAQGLRTTPYAVKRAIENTANQIEETVGGGAGLVQVEKAYDYLLAYNDSLLHSIHFDVKHTAKSATFRGIYLKDQDEVNETRDYQLTIEPKFFENKSRSFELNEALEKDENLLTSQKEKISLNRRLGLVWESEEGSKNWLECPSYFYLVNSSRVFPIRIHANELEEGKVYFTHVKAIDLEDPKKPCIFKIPITVVKPFLIDSKKNTSNELEFKNVSFKQGQIYRHFVRAPHGATHAEITLKCDQLGNESKDHSPLFYLQTFTLGSFRTQADSANEEVFRLNTSNEFKHVFKVQANKVLQISIAKNWSNIGHVLANYKVKFRGLSPKNSHEIYCSSGQPCKLEVGSYLAHEDCEITVSYKHYIQAIKPAENQIEIVKPTLGLIKPVYQIILTYNFHQTKTEDVTCEVPLISHQLYENEFQSAFWMVYETHTKRYLYSGDAFPVIYKYTKSLEKGDYTIKLFIRHEKIDTLEKLKDTTLLVRRGISALNQDVYGSYSSLLKGTGKKTSAERIQKESERVFYLAPIAEDKLPKGVQSGSFLSGDLTLFKDATISKVDKHRVFYQINAHGTSTAKKQQGSAASSKEKTPTTPSTTTPSGNKPSDDQAKVDEKLRDAIRDVQVAHILKSNDIFESLRKEYPDHVPIYINRIQYLDQQLNSASSVIEVDRKLAIYDEIIALSGLALSKINQSELFKFFGEKHHDSSQDENKKEFETQRGWVIELLVHQGVALIERQLIENKDESAGSAIKSIRLNEELRQVYRSLQKWIDLNDEKVSKFIVKFYMHQKYYGKCLKLLFKQLEDKPASSKTIDQSILNILDEMGLKHAKRYLTNSIVMKYPTRFFDF